MVYDELMKRVEGFTNEDMKAGAMRVLKKIPEKDWEQFDGTALEAPLNQLTGDLKQEFELVEKMNLFGRRWALKTAGRLARGTDAEAAEYKKELLEMRKRKRKNQS